MEHRRRRLAALVVLTLLVTTVPPADLMAEASLAVEHVSGQGDRSVVLSGVPGYEWRHGSGPTAMGMVMGYYDGLGMDDLIPGDASTQTPEVDQAIASERSALDPGHYEDYCLPLDTLGGVLPDLSELPDGDEHADDCIADYLLASRSVVPNHYGWCRAVHVADAFISYITSINPDYYPRAIEYNMTIGELTWEMVTGEIDAGRPMIFLVDSDGNETEDRYVTVVGYSDTTVQMYACLDTEAPADSVRWCEFATVQNGQEWGIWHGWTLDPDHTLHVDAAGGADHTDIQDALDEILTGGRVIVHPGTYTGTRNRDLEFGGKTIVLESQAGRGLTTIDCEGLGRAFNFASQEDAVSTVDGFTIKDGVADFGGGIRCFWSSSPTLRNLTIDGCSATSDGGGVWTGGGAIPSLENVTIVGCTAGRGGAVHCNAASPVLAGVTMHANSATSGGGISCALTSSPVIERSIISGSTSGGPLFCGGTGVPSTTHCCVYGNAGGDSLCGDYAENLFLDPLFCDAGAGVFTLEDDSPCLPENNAWSELIGAHGNGNCSTSVPDIPEGGVATFALSPPTPNPSAHTTHIGFSVPEPRSVSLVVFDAAGRRVRTLATAQRFQAGPHHLQWDGRDETGTPAASGVYFYRIEADGEKLTGRVVLLR